MAHIEINDLKEDIALSEDEIKHVKGGISLLLPAVQTVKLAPTYDAHEKWIEISSVSLYR